MSARTVSARRRPVVATEKKTTNNEILADDVGISQVNANPRENVTSTRNGRYLSHHSIRGEAVLERSSKDFVQVKKPVGHSTALPRRTCKVHSKPERLQWVTVLSIIAKNFVPVVVFVGLVQLIWGFALTSGDSVVGIQSRLLEFEGRIADVESLLRTTAKMIQVQVDVEDRKIENKIRNLKKEMSEKIDDQGAILESELRKLEAKSEGPERSLGDLKAVDWLSEEEFQKFYDEVKKSKGSDFGDASLDDVRTHAREIIEKEMEKHAADGLGRVDYALASGGAMVVKHSEPYKVKRGIMLSAKNGVHSNADNMLKPSFGEPGQCFALKGSTGFVQIKLRTAIIPEAVTLEHAAKNVANDRSSAPKDCRVTGWLQGRNTVAKTEKMFLLSEFKYDLDKSNAQTFDVWNSAIPGLIDTIRLDFTSNHGSPSHTCIYRLRVHGHEPDVVSMMKHTH